MADKGFPIKPEFISLRLGEGYVTRLKDIAMKESIRKSMPVSPSDVVKEALRKAYPELFTQ